MPPVDVGGPVLVIGGTRGTGYLIAERLIARGTPVRVLARRPDRATRLFGTLADIVQGDLTKPDTLPPAITDARAIVLTAGSRSGYPASESRVRSTDFDGVRHVISATRDAGFAGRLLYMTSMGVTVPSFAARLLNLYKGNTLVWRRRAEDEIRAGGFDYTIVRAGFLLNSSGGRHALTLTQDPLPLSLRYRIARADVAEVFVAALESSAASRVTFDLFWAGRGRVVPDLLERLQPDASPGEKRVC